MFDRFYFHHVAFSHICKFNRKKRKKRPGSLNAIYICIRWYLDVSLHLVSFIYP